MFGKISPSNLQISCNNHIDVQSKFLQCSVAIRQLTKGRNKEEKETSDLQTLAAEGLQRDYKQRAPNKLPLLMSMLKNMKLNSWFWFFCEILVTLIKKIHRSDEENMVYLFGGFFSSFPFGL